jgi:Ras-related protein Rab-32
MFVCVVQWLSDLREKVTLQDGTRIPVVLLANKCDIQGIEIAIETVAKFCKDNGIAAWFITSAKENINIGNINIYTFLPVLYMGLNLSFSLQRKNAE